MKKKIAVLIIFSALLQVTFAKINFRLSPFLFLTYGKMGEYLYDSSGQKINSYLEWEEKPLWGGGVEVKVKVRDFGFSVSGALGVPSSCGKMYDSDYFYNSTNPGGVKFIYSIHQAKSDFSFFGNATAQYDFHPATRFALAPVFQVDYSYVSLKARGGYGWYGNLESGNVPWDSENAVYHKKLYGINFCRHEVNLWTGLTASFDVTDRLTATANFSTAVWTYDFSIDEHLGVKNPFVMQEYVSANFARLKCGLGFDIKITKKISVAVLCDAIFGFERKGETYMKFPLQDDSFFKSSQDTGSATTRIDTKCAFSFAL